MDICKGCFHKDVCKYEEGVDNFNSKLESLCNSLQIKLNVDSVKCEKYVPTENVIIADFKVKEPMIPRFVPLNIDAEKDVPHPSSNMKPKDQTENMFKGGKCIWDY